MEHSQRENHNDRRMVLQDSNNNNNNTKNRCHYVPKKFHSGLPIDSLTFLDSDNDTSNIDDDDKNVYIQKSNTTRLSTETKDIWAFSTLLTGLSCNDTVTQSLSIKVEKHNKLQKQQKLNKNQAIPTKKLNPRPISAPVQQQQRKDALPVSSLLLLCNHSDADSENDTEIHQHRKCATSKQQNKYIRNNLHQNQTQVQRKKKNHNVKRADRFVSTKLHPMVALKSGGVRSQNNQESDLFIAATQINSNGTDSDHASLSSSQSEVQGNLLSLFQNQLMVSSKKTMKPPVVTSILLQSVPSTEEEDDDGKMKPVITSKKRSQVSLLRSPTAGCNNNNNNCKGSINNENSHHHSPFTSPMQIKECSNTGSRQRNSNNKRRDRKNTPDIKSGIINCYMKQRMVKDNFGTSVVDVDTKHHHQQQQQAMDQSLIQNTTKDMVSYDDDDTASSLSNDDDSCSVKWSNENCIQNQFMTKTSNNSPDSSIVHRKLDCVSNNKLETTLFISSNSDNYEIVVKENVQVNAAEDVVDSIMTNADTSTDVIGSSIMHADTPSKHVDVDNYQVLLKSVDHATQGDAKSEIVSNDFQLETTQQPVNIQEQGSANDPVENQLEYTASEHVIDNSSIQEGIKNDDNIRRSRRARTITNRFTVTDVDTSIKPKNIETKKSKAVAEPNNTVSNARPQRERKKTDFYHNNLEMNVQRNMDSAVLKSIPVIPNQYPYCTNDEEQRPRVSVATSEEKIKVPPEDDLRTRKNGMNIRSAKASSTEVVQGIIKTANEEKKSNIDDNNTWSVEQLQQLYDAKEQVDPTSSSYWIDVANIVQSKTATECQMQWFSTVKTPLHKSKHGRSKFLSDIHDVPPAERDEDDIFQSTPMRYNVYSNSMFAHTFDPIQLPTLPITTEILDEENDSSHNIMKNSSNLHIKPIPKAFIQRMKRDFAKTKPSLQVPAQSKGKHPSAKAFTEILRDDDIDINIRLTPGGTLKVKSQINVEEDDFWDDEYDADEENENNMSAY